MSLVPAYRCSHSGLYYPSDYVKEWGKKYGIGMGSVPLSECLDTLDTAPIPPMDSNGARNNPSAPVGLSYAQLDFVMITQEEYDANKAILAIDDPDMSKRMAIIREKQKTKPKFNQIFKGGN